MPSKSKTSTTKSRAASNTRKKSVKRTTRKPSNFWQTLSGSIYLSSGRTKHPRAFSMVELLVVLSILLILIIISSIVFRRMMVYGKDSRKKDDIDRLRIALEGYAGDFTVYPDPALVADCNSNSLSPYLNNVPCIKRGNVFQPYLYVRSQDGLAYALYTILENTNDDAIIQANCENGCGPDIDGDGIPDYNYGVGGGNVLFDQIPIPDDLSLFFPTPGVVNPTNTPAEGDPNNATVTPGVTLTPIQGEDPTATVTPPDGATSSVTVTPTLTPTTTPSGGNCTLSSLSVIPTSGNWNKTATFAVTNTCGQAITFNWLLDVWGDAESDQVGSTTLQPNESVELGLGLSCDWKWQLDLFYQGQEKGYIVELANNCDNPEPVPTSAPESFTYGTTPPMVSCPAGTMQIGDAATFTLVREEDDGKWPPAGYQFSGTAVLPQTGYLFITGWAMQGHPDESCPFSPDPSNLCRAQANEGFYIDINNVQKKYVPDFGDNHWVSFSYAFNEYAAGSHSFRVRHENVNDPSFAQSPGSVDVRAVACLQPT